MPLVGLEPTRQKTPVPKTGTSTIPSQRLIFNINKKLNKVNLVKGFEYWDQKDTVPITLFMFLL